MVSAGAALIMAMQLSTAIKLKLRARMICGILCRIVKIPNVVDGVATYERLGRIRYSRAEKREIGRCDGRLDSSTRSFQVVRGWVA